MTWAEALLSGAAGPVRVSGAVFVPPVQRGGPAVARSALTPADPLFNVVARTTRT